MSRSKRPSHAHARKYPGEAAAQALLEWLNSRTGKKVDPIERMLLAFADIAAKTNEYQAMRSIRKILRETKLRLTPFWYIPMVKSGTESRHRPGVYLWKLDRSRSVIKWDPVAPRMSRAHALAFHKLLDLASQGLAVSVRRCAWQKCRRWYFSRFDHHTCCSAQCQQRAARSTPEYKEERKAYMKKHRRREKLRVAKQRELIERERTKAAEKVAKGRRR